MKKQRINVALSSETHSKLTALGQKGETYDRIIMKLLKLHERIPQIHALVSEIAIEGLTRADTSTKEKIRDRRAKIRKLLSLG